MKGSLKKLSACVMSRSLQQAVWRNTLIICVLIMTQCKVGRDIQEIVIPGKTGVARLAERCPAVDTIENILISKSEAVLLFGGKRYDVTLTLFAKKDSAIYLSAVSSGFEIIRARADRDSIRIIDRLNRVVYLMPLFKRFGFQHPVSFSDLENLVSVYHLCDDLENATETGERNLLFEFDEQWIKKRIILSDRGPEMQKFEFLHARTGEYLMGERTGEGIVIYSNFIVGDFEIATGGGERTFNSDMEVDMKVNPRRYTFIDLQ